MKSLDEYQSNIDKLERELYAYIWRQRRAQIVIAAISALIASLVVWWLV